MDYGIKSTHSALKNKLISYILAQYLGENRMLLEASKGEIDKLGTLYQEPFIEANPAYEVKENGIENSKLPDDIKQILNDIGIFLSSDFSLIDYDTKPIKDIKINVIPDIIIDEYLLFVLSI